MDWTFVLSAMLQLQAPGRSIYSRVEVPKDASAPCQEASILCEPPRWDTERQAWTVAESYGEGLVRYALIAQVIDRVARKQKELPGEAMRRLLVTVAYHESGFRRDVHEGVGEASQGDCKWQTVGGRQVRVPGTCRSRCLAQILLPKGEKTSEGWGPAELMGLDEAATERCFTVAARYLGTVWKGCAYDGLGGPLCVFARYGGMAAGTTDKRIQARVATFRRALFAPLSDEVRVLLGLSAEEADRG